MDLWKCLVVIFFGSDSRLQVCVQPSKSRDPKSKTDDESRCPKYKITGRSRCHKFDQPPTLCVRRTTCDAAPVNFPVKSVRLLVLTFVLTDCRLRSLIQHAVIIVAKHTTALIDSGSHFNPHEVMRTIRPNEPRGTSTASRSDCRIFKRSTSSASSTSCK